MSHAGSFPYVIDKLTKELDDASRIVIEIRLRKQAGDEQTNPELIVVSVNGFTRVNGYSHYIASLVNCFIEDTRNFIFTLPVAERSYFLEQLISSLRRLEKVAVPIDLSKQTVMDHGKVMRKCLPGQMPGKRVPRRYHDPHLPFFRWIFRECEVSIPSPEGNFKMPVIDDETYSDVTGKAWKYSTAWSQQLWNARNELEDLKRFAELIPVLRVQDENCQFQPPKLTVSATRDVLGAFFRVLKESNVFGNTPSGEICKSAVAGFSTKNCTDLQLKRFRNIFDVPTQFALECCISECRNFIAICEKLMRRYSPN